jgi:hypothetical protein
MKTPRNLGLVAIAIFIISYLLPAFEGMSGFACFGYCWNMLLGHDGAILSGGWFYYSGFVLSNILFIGLAVALFVTTKSRRLRSVLSIVCFLQVLSWLVLFTISGKPSQIAAIKIGYYVWLTAYALLVAAHLWKMTPSNEAPAPNRRARFPLGVCGQFLLFVLGSTSCQAAVGEVQR